MLRLNPASPAKLSRHAMIPVHNLWRDSAARASRRVGAQRPRHRELAGELAIGLALSIARLRFTVRIIYLCEIARGRLAQQPESIRVGGWHWLHNIVIA